jgi:septal ring factor EnvC (AmiA/AmiB activator)
MAEDCSQVQTITKIETAVQQNQAITSNLQKSLHEITVEMRDIFREMRDIMATDKEDRQRIMTLEKTNDILFTRVRRLEDDVVPNTTNFLNKKIDVSLKDLCTKMDNQHQACDKRFIPLTTWKNQNDGRMMGAKAIPIICVIITTGIAIWTMVKA